MTVPRGFSVPFPARTWADGVERLIDEEERVQTLAVTVPLPPTTNTQESVRMIGMPQNDIVRYNKTYEKPRGADDTRGAVKPNKEV